jgi:hypothetical protein
LLVLMWFLDGDFSTLKKCHFWKIILWIFLDGDPILERWYERQMRLWWLVECVGSHPSQKREGWGTRGFVAGIEKRTPVFRVDLSIRI